MNIYLIICIPYVSHFVSLHIKRSTQCHFYFLFSFFCFAGGMNGSVVFEIDRPENGGLKRPVRVRIRQPQTHSTYIMCSINILYITHCTLYMSYICIIYQTLYTCTQSNSQDTLSQVIVFHSLVIFIIFFPIHLFSGFSFCSF